MHDTDTLQEGTMIVDVEISDLETVEEDGSVISVTGTSRENPTHRIRFAGDHRSMVGLLTLVEAEGGVPAVIEEWQVLSTTTVEPS
jgi:hypothetical protein